MVNKEQEKAAYIKCTHVCASVGLCNNFKNKLMVFRLSSALGIYISVVIKQKVQQLRLLGRPRRIRISYH